MGAYGSVSLLPLGDALTIVFTSPLPVMILSFLCLGKRLRLYKISAGVCIMLGICMIAQPSFLFNGRCETFLFGTKSPQTFNETYNGTSPYKTRYVQYDQSYYLGVLVAATASVCLLYTSDAADE